MGKGRKKKRTQRKEKEDPNTPKTFVLHRGEVTHAVETLVSDFRGVMKPHTAAKLKVLKRNVLKDFVNVAGPLGVTHMLVFSQGEMSLNLRVGRLPRGPTLTFRIDSFCLARDVLASLAHPKLVRSAFQSPPLLVLNNFPKDTMHMQLMTKMFQNIFPSINVTKVDLRTIRRVVLFNFDPATGTIDFRHYDIGVRAAGTSRSVRSIMTTNVPNLEDFEDIADFVLKGSQAYESEGEDAATQVVLPQTVHGAGNKESSQSAIRLTELGPRMQMRLLKIEEGLCGGQVMYHSLVKKTPKEIAALAARKEELARLKNIRKQQQAENVKRKAMEIQARRQEKELEKKRVRGLIPDQAYERDDDAEYYRKEVGREPSSELGLSGRYKRRGPEERDDDDDHDDDDDEKEDHEDGQHDEGADDEGEDEGEGEEKQQKQKHGKGDKSGGRTKRSGETKEKKKGKDKKPRVSFETDQSEAKAKGKPSSTTPGKSDKPAAGAPKASKGAIGKFKGKVMNTRPAAAAAAAGPAASKGVVKSKHKKESKGQ